MRQLANCTASAHLQ